jgi:hypothetical protein
MEQEPLCAALKVLTSQLASDEVLRIARLDAERVYRDLSRFVIRVAREPDGWHVDFDLTDSTAAAALITSSLPKAAPSS